MCNMSKLSNDSGSTSNSPACAVCKYQRRRCAPDCVCAPYFPANLPEQFMNTHKLYGVSNLTKILNSVPPEKRGAAANSIIREANYRAQDKVYGARGVVLLLEKELNRSMVELREIRRQLQIYRFQPKPIEQEISTDFHDNESRKQYLYSLSDLKNAQSWQPIQIKEPIRSISQASNQIASTWSDQEESTSSVMVSSKDLKPWHEESAHAGFDSKKTINSRLLLEYTPQNAQNKEQGFASQDANQIQSLSDEVKPRKVEKLLSKALQPLAKGSTVIKPSKAFQHLAKGSTIINPYRESNKKVQSSSFHDNEISSSPLKEKKLPKVKARSPFREINSDHLETSN